MDREALKETLRAEREKQAKIQETWRKNEEISQFKDVEPQEPEKVVDPNHEGGFVNLLLSFQR